MARALEVVTDAATALGIGIAGAAVIHQARAAVAARRKAGPADAGALVADFVFAAGGLAWAGAVLRQNRAVVVNVERHRCRRY